MPYLSVVIPTLNGERELLALLDRLMRQTHPADEILVVDSSSDDRTCEIATSYPGVRVISVERDSFNHGLTRDYALRETSGEYVAFLTQDAVPANNNYLSNLTAPLDMDPEVALVSGRQLPRDDARRFECLVREFNYPARSHVRTIEDLPRLGIKTYFASDVCSCYRRTAYLAAGGFDKVKTNEDMLMAARLLKAGYKVVYAANAEVIHSHNLTPSEQFRRNRMVGEFLAEHDEELAVPDEVGEGSRLAKNILNELLHEGMLGEAAAFVVDCAARFIGNRMGRFKTHRGA